jgi:hypothetical protein
MVAVAGRMEKTGMLPILPSWEIVFIYMKAHENQDGY